MVDDFLVLALRENIQRGSFQLSSGEQTDWYLDAKQVTWGIDGFLANAAVLEAIQSRGIVCDAIGGVSFGGAPMALGCAFAQDKPSFAVRNVVKDHGTASRIVGPLQPGQRVVLVEDVVTTFASLISAIQAVFDFGAIVVGAVCLVNQGNPNVHVLCEDIPFVSIVTLAELGV